MTVPAIEVEGLAAGWGGIALLEDFDLRIATGETRVILGASGCGKSTLLRHLLGLERPMGGSIRLQGQDITEMSDEEVSLLRRRVGVLFQSGGLLNSLSVFDNVALPLREHTELDESTIGIMVRMKLGLVGLGEAADRLPSALSGGMKKRAGLARALAMDPEILFADEPSAGLDPVVAAGLDHLLLQLKKTFGMTMVVVTHELESAFLIADRIAMLHEGSLLFDGELQALRQSQDPVIRRFLDRSPEETEDRSAYLESLLGDGETPEDGKGRA